MPTMVLSPILKQFFLGNDGSPLFQGLLYSYQAGTSIPIATFQDSTGLSANTNPIILDARGSANVWIAPNTAYKFVLTDALGRVIFSEDRVIQSQLLTLYGGVDTGGVNAYVIAFAANFTTYLDGTMVTFIPANSNTGASTININQLGPIPVLNADGSALVAGSLTANVPAQLLIKGGQAILLNPYASNLRGLFTPNWVGFSGSPPGTVQYSRTGNVVSLQFSVTLAGSNATTFALSNLPALLQQQGSAQILIPCLGLVDSGVNVASPSVAALPRSSPVINFYKDSALTGWTATGQKGFSPGTSLVYAV